MSIFANHPMVLPNGSNVNVCFQNGDKIVSLSLDDSCGRMELLGRGTIELHRKTRSGGVAVCTDEIFTSPMTVPATMVNFDRALRWMNKVSWGFDAQDDSYQGLPVYK
tara:strand:+ start:221 stop:544 length:324 start_codon:yes stop_codon:yes gene_type:complete